MSSSTSRNSSRGIALASVTRVRNCCSTVAVRPEVVDEGRRLVGRIGDRQRPVEDVVRGPRRRDAVGGRVEHRPGAGRLGDGIALLHHAAEAVVHGAAGDDHDVGRGVGAGRIECQVFLRLRDAGQAVDERHGLDEVGDVAILVEMARARPRLEVGIERQGGIEVGVILHGDGGERRTLLVGPGDGERPAHRVVGGGDDLGVDVRGLGLRAPAQVVLRRRGVAEAVGDGGHVRVGDRLIRIGEAIALPGVVGRTRQRGEVAERVVGHVGDGSGAASQQPANLEEVAGAGLERRLTLAHQNAVTGDADGRGLADDVGGEILVVGDVGRDVVGGPRLRRVDVLRDVAERVVGEGLERGLAGRRQALEPALVGARQLREGARRQVGWIDERQLRRLVTHHVAVLHLREGIAGSVGQGLLGQQHLGVERGVVIEPLDHAVGLVAGRIELRLDAFCKAEELAFAPLEEAALPGVRLEHAVFAVTGLAVVDEQARQGPAVLRLQVGVAGAHVVDLERGHQRTRHALEHVGAAVRVAGRRDGAVVGRLQVIGIAVAVDVGDGGLTAAQRAREVRARVDDDVGRRPDRNGDREVGATALRFLALLGEVAAKARRPGHVGEETIAGIETDG